MRLNTDYVWNAGEKHDSLISLYAFWEKFGLLSPNFWFRNKWKLNLHVQHHASDPITGQFGVFIYGVELLWLYCTEM